MAQMRGMDPGQVRAFARQLESSAQELRSTVKELDGALKGAQWRGPDRVKFDEDWSRRAAELRRVAEAISRAAQDASRQADNQEAASR